MATQIEFLETQRLKAQRLAPEHLPDYLSLLPNPLVMKTMSPDGLPLSAELATAWLALSVAHWETHGFGYWAFYERDYGKFIGRGGLRTTTIDGPDDIELAYALLPEFWNRGLATEIATASLDVAFRVLRVPHVLCYTLATNRASQRVMEKAGFRYEKEVTHAGLPHVFYRIAAAEFTGGAL